MDIDIKSIVFYKNDFENLSEMDKLERAEIIECLLSELFFDEKPLLTKNQWTAYKMLKDKIMRSVKNYHNNNPNSLKKGVI